MYSTYDFYGKKQSDTTWNRRLDSDNICNKFLSYTILFMTQYLTILNTIVRQLSDINSCEFTNHISSTARGGWLKFADYLVVNDNDYLNICGVTNQHFLWMESSTGKYDTRVWLVRNPLKIVTSSLPTDRRVADLDWSR